MESADNSSINTSPEQRSFRKLRWKNYLNHLLNLWLLCGNVSVDGRKLAVLLHDEPHATTPAATTSSSSRTATFYNASFKPSSNWENHKSFHVISNFNRTVASHATSHDDGSAGCYDANINASNNKSSLSEKLFHSIKSKAERKEDLLRDSINHSISPDQSSGIITRKDAGRPENIVNTTRITNVRARRAKKNPENEFSNHYNQSSRPLKNHGNHQSARKKVKSDRKPPANATAAAKSARKLSKVSLLGLFEMTTHLGTRWEGRSELAAAELAVKHINERGLLPGYTLELITNDTQVTSAFHVCVRA